jgi:hypothetical protein
MENHILEKFFFEIIEFSDEDDDIMNDLSEEETESNDDLFEEGTENSDNILEEEIVEDDAHSIINKKNKEISFENNIKGKKWNRESKIKNFEDDDFDDNFGDQFTDNETERKNKNNMK